VTGSTRSDCIVVGAGLIGLSTALHLGWRGLTVRVLERGRLGDGTSSKASGWISAQLRTPNPLLELVLESQSSYVSFLDEVGDRCAYEESGSLVVFDSEEQLDQRRLLDATQREVARYAGAQFVDAAAVHELEPALSDAIVGGALFSADAQVDPLSLLEAMLRRASTSRTSVHQGAAVTRLVREGGTWRATTAIGDFDAPVVVITAGAWSPELSELAGFALPILPVSGQLLVSEPRERDIRHCVVYQPDARFATRLACGLRPALDGRLWLGTTYRAGTFDVSITSEDTDAIRGAVGDVFPRLAGLAIEQAWAGVRPVPSDLLPVYGRVSALDGFFVGVPVAGLAECAAAGRLMADLVCGERPRIDAQPFSPDRFADAE